ncbi:MAG: HEAT repeat domain-containing protein [Bryobacteraceae bacterium]|jgi:HEAT repeat protein
MHPDKIRALCSPGEPLEHTVSLVRTAMEAEPLFDVQMAELLLGRSSDEAVDQRIALRILEILDRVSPGTRLTRMIGTLVRHADPQVRSKAAMVAGRRMEGFPWIYAHLLEADPRVRANMIEALWESREPECLEVFELYRNDGDHRVASNVLYGLYLRGEAGAIPGVMQMITHDDPKFRAAAAWLLGKIGQPEFVEVLRRMVNDADRRVKGSALKALVRIHRATSGASAIPDK